MLLSFDGLILFRNQVCTIVSYEAMMILVLRLEPKEIAIAYIQLYYIKTR